jgi:AmmeMemoRadiSam system protein A
MQTASRFTSEQQQLLLATASASIQSGLRGHGSFVVDPAEVPAPLNELGACFVTLRIEGELRGCIGTLEASQALIRDVVKNAFSAAFHDPRFPPLTSEEFDRIEIHLSVLTPPEPLPCDSEEDLLSRVRPGVDGLILRDRGRRATLIPAFWESEPDPHRFLGYLKRKAGLPRDYWSDSLEFFRYTAEGIHGN